MFAALFLAAAALQPAMRLAPSSSRVVAPSMAYKGFWESDEYKAQQVATAKKAPKRRAASKPAPKTYGLVSPVRGAGKTPARAFEQSFAPLYVPSRVKKTRPDLKKMNDATDNKASAAKSFEAKFAPIFVPSREAARRPDLKAMNVKK